MKKIIGCLAVMALFPATLIVGCNTSTPAGPAGPAGTPTSTATRTVTSTPMSTATPQAPQLTVNLGSAVGFAVLAHTQITNSGFTNICGDVGLSPGSSGGGGYTMKCGGVKHITDTAAANAKVDLAIAYTDAAGRSIPAPASVSGNIGGQTLYPGLYKSTGSLEISSGNLTLDALGDPNGVFIFQIASTLTATSGRKVILAGGAKASRVFWQVGSSCALGTTVDFKGTIMAYNLITLNTGAKLEGRAMSKTEQVTMLFNAITKPAP